MMNLRLLRFSPGKESTLGLLLVDPVQFLCFTLEDQHQTTKVYGETRIPAGMYHLTLREYGTHHDKYKARYGFHQGMLELLNVPGFTDVLMHIGNKDDDTAGCILVGDSSEQNITEDGFIGASGNAYARVYPPIASAISNGGYVSLRIEDLAI